MLPPFARPFGRPRCPRKTVHPQRVRFPNGGIPPGTPAAARFPASLGSRWPQKVVGMIRKTRPENALVPSPDAAFLGNSRPTAGPSFALKNLEQSAEPRPAELPRPVSQPINPRGVKTRVIAPSRLLPADCAGIVREKRMDSSHLNAHLRSLLNELVVGPTELESVTSTVSR